MRCPKCQMELDTSSKSTKVQCEWCGAVFEKRKKEKGQTAKTTPAQDSFTADTPTPTPAMEQFQAAKPPRKTFRFWLLVGSVILIAGSAILIASCVTAWIFYPKDPAASFREHIDQNKSQIIAQFRSSNRNVKGDFSYDVQKTNSLVSPYVGYVYFSCSQEISRPEFTLEFHFRAKLSYAYQNDLWTYKGGEITIESGDVLSAVDENTRHFLCKPLIKKQIGRTMKSDDAL